MATPRPSSLVLRENAVLTALWVWRHGRFLACAAAVASATSGTHVTAIASIHTNAVAAPSMNASPSPRAHARSAETVAPESFDVANTPTAPSETLRKSARAANDAGASV